MTWELIRRNPAWRMTPFFAAASTVLWVLSAPGGGGAGRAAAQGLTQVMFMICILLPEFRQRYTRLQAALPIAGKQLFLARIASLLAFIWLPILTAVAATLILRGDRNWADHFPLLEAGVVVTVLLMLVQCVRAGTVNPPAWLVVLAFAGQVVALPMLGINPNFPGPTGVVITVLGAGALVSTALVLQAWANIPKSFQFAPSEPVSARPARKGHAWPTIAWWPVLHSMYGRWQMGLFLFVAFTTTVTGNGGFALLLIPSFFFESWGSVRWLLHLPVSLRKLFWSMLLPPTAAMMVGLLLNVPFNDDRSRDPVVLVSGTLNVQVPPAYWRWARGGTAPVIEAPWGEHSQPETAAWSRFVFYNPYAVGPGNSRRFLDWQFTRATSAVYGQPVARSQVNEIRGMKTMTQQPKSRIIALAAVLIYWLIQICSLCLSASKRLRSAHATIKFLLILGPMPFGYAIFVAPLFLHIPGRGNAIMDFFALNLARVLPDNPWMLALVAALPLAGLYWLAESLFGEVEFGQFGVKKQRDMTTEV